MRTMLLAALVMTGVPSAIAQPAASPTGAESNAATLLSLDVISVRPNRGTATNASMGMNRDGFTATNVDLHSLLLQAFELQEDDQLLGEPKWTSSDRWDIEARVAPEDIDALAKMSFHDRLAMFQKILVERFSLRFHYETRNLPVYALVVAPGGPKVTPSKSQRDPNGVPGDPGVLNSSRGKEVGSGTMMKFLAEDLSDVLGRKVVDRTGLAGRYDFTLTYAPDSGAVAAAANPASGDSQAPSLFTAVQEQLGLKLEPVKAQVDVVVIDHLEKPGEN